MYQRRISAKPVLVVCSLLHGVGRNQLNGPMAADATFYSAAQTFVPLLHAHMACYSMRRPCGDRIARCVNIFESITVAAARGALGSARVTATILDSKLRNAALCVPKKARSCGPQCIIRGHWRGATVVCLWAREVETSEDLEVFTGVVAPQGAFQSCMTYCTRGGISLFLWLFSRD